MTEHSPLPLSRDERDISAPYIYNADGRIIAKVLGLAQGDEILPYRENAAYFIKACNAYPELVKALEECVAVLTDPVVGTYAADDPRWYKLLDEAVANALAVLAKAKAAP